MLTNLAQHDDDGTQTQQAGGICAVVGQVGAGKSSLLAAILGELKPLGGEARGVRAGAPSSSSSSFSSSSAMAFVPQSPFVISGTLRDNVLCGALVLSPQPRNAHH